MCRTVTELSRGSRLFFRLIVAAIWTYAGGIKILDPDRFLSQVSQFSVANASMNSVVAHGLPWLEFVLGVCMLRGIALLESLAAGMLLSGIYVILQITIWHRGLGIDCGCGLSFGHDIIGAKTISRTLLFLSLNCVAFWQSLAKTSKGVAGTTEISPA